MDVKKADIIRRWKNIRMKPECELSLTAQAVGSFLEVKESELVRGKIIETLTHLANLRISNSNFINDRPNIPGDLVTCEGLETFLVPAVEGVLPFSEFLDQYPGKKDIIIKIRSDLEDLLSLWQNNSFPGKPYANPDAIRKNINPSSRDEFKKINIVEAAAMACRVLVHLMTLGFNRSNETTFVKEFHDIIDLDRLTTPLTNAIKFLVSAFQKGQDSSNPIGSAKFSEQSGSGWSWTERQGLPPMLFFSAAAVDAFAELDLYLIRPAEKNEINDKLLEYYTTIRDPLEELTFCVDMTRRWTLNKILPDISTGLGIYAESFADGTKLEFDDNPEGYTAYKEELSKFKDMTYSPLVLYNNLYALLILLWSYGDWDDVATDNYTDGKSMIERAITQLVYNYRNISICNEILNQFSYTFYLPGKDIFRSVKEKNDLAYLDSGFLTLLTRLIVLYLAYGVGDRNILEPLVRELYVDLLLDRYREERDFSYLWSKKNKEIFSTQRAIQALTFYTLYARGKDVISIQTLPQSADEWSGFFTKIALVLKNNQEDISAHLKEGNQHQLLTEKNFIEYLDNILGDRTTPHGVEQTNFVQNIEQIGGVIFTDLQSGNIAQKEGMFLLNAFVFLRSLPNDTDDEPRYDEFKILEKKYGEIKKLAKKNNSI